MPPRVGAPGWALVGGGAGLQGGREDMEGGREGEPGRSRLLSCPVCFKWWLSGPPAEIPAPSLTGPSELLESEPLCHPAWHSQHFIAP